MKNTKASLKLKDKDLTFLKRNDGALILKTKNEEIELDVMDARVISTFIREFCIPKTKVKIGKELTEVCKEVILLENDKFEHSD